MSTFDLESLVVDIPDYPEPGVIFKDITPLMADPQGLAACVDRIAERYADAGITKVVGAEARGFLVGAPVAYKLGAGFVPARKPGKLPRAVYSQSYALEYGTDELQIHQDAMGPEDRVLVVDDLVATAGTAVAAGQLVQQTGAELVAFAFVLELAYLGPRKAIGTAFPGYELYSLIRVD